MTPCVVFLQLPTAADSSIDDLLTRAYGEDLRVFGKDAQASLAALSPEQRAGLRCLRGPLPHGVHTLLEQPCRYLMLLEDPVDRLIALYQHATATGGLPPAHTLLDFVSQGGSATENPLTRLLAGQHEAHGQVERFEDGPATDRATPADFEHARQLILSGEVQIGLHSRLAESLFLFRQALGWPVGLLGDPPRPPSGARAEIPPATLAAIQERNAHDLALYQLAARQFQAALDRTPRPLPSWFPASGVPRQAILEQNLAVLRLLDPQLIDRLPAPVDTPHLRRKADGALELWIHRRWYLLEGTPERQRQVLESVTGDRPILLLGIGGGALLADLLACHPEREIIAWDRDPIMLSQTLQQWDLRRPLRTGRLKLVLGADLLDLLGRVGDHQWLGHTFLGMIYRRERQLLETSTAEDIVLLREGPLMVDDIARALQARGLPVYTLDVENLSPAELQHTVRRTRARLLFTINHTPGLARFTQENGLELICWQIDPSLVRPRPPSCPTDDCHLFLHRQALVAPFQAVGYRQVEYLPLAADIHTRRPLRLSPAERETYGAPISFVGQSLVRDARNLRTKFVLLYAQWRGISREEATRAVHDRLEAILAAQRQRLARYLIPELLPLAFPKFIHGLAQTRPEVDLEVLVAQSSAAEKRLSYVSQMSRHGIRVWGDAGWRTVVGHGVAYQGRYAGHRRELGQIYCASQINLDIGRIYQSDIITMRVFDVLACGGFLLAEHSSALEQAFDVGHEIIAYRNHRELEQLVSHYLAHPEEARAVAARGHQAVLERHTIRQRLDTMLGRTRWAPPHAPSLPPPDPDPTQLQPGPPPGTGQVPSALPDPT